MASIIQPELSTARTRIGPRSLHRMALSIAILEASSIFDVGDLPFELAEPILDHVEDPYQLAEIAENCPQISVETEKMEEKYAVLLDKQFPRWRTKNYPIDDTMDFLEIVDFLYQAKADEEKAAYAKLVDDMAKASTPKHQVTIVKTGTLDERGHKSGGKSWGRSRPNGPLGRIRRAVAQAQRARNTTPIKPVPSGKSQISRAPEGMIRDHIIAKRKATYRVIPPRKTSQSQNLEDTVSHRSDLHEREARLNAAKNARAALSTHSATPDDRQARESRLLAAKFHRPTSVDVRDREARLLAAKTKRPAADDDDDAASPEPASKRARLDNKASTSAAASPSRQTTAATEAHAKSADSMSPPPSPQKTPNVAATKKSTGILSNAHIKPIIRKVAVQVPVKNTSSSSKVIVASKSQPIKHKDSASPKTGSGTGVPTKEKRAGEEKVDDGKQKVEAKKPAARPRGPPKKREVRYFN